MPNASAMNSFARSSSSHNLSSLANSIPANDQPGSASSGRQEDGSWLDFLSVPSARFDHNTPLGGFEVLAATSLTGLAADRESVPRNTNESLPPVFDFRMGSGSGSGPFNDNGLAVGFGSGVASRGGYGLGLGLSEREGTSPIEQRLSRAESMDIDGDRIIDKEREPERAAERTAEAEKEDEGRLRKRPRWV